MPFNEHKDFGGYAPMGVPDAALPSVPRPEPDDPFDLAERKFPLLGAHRERFNVIQSEDKGDGRQVEFYPPWERDNPSPGKATIELFGTKTGPDEIANLVAGDALHYLGSVDPESGKAVDPKFREMKDRFLSSITPEQEAIDRKAYERDRGRYTNPPEFDDWMEMNRGDAYIRGYLTPDARDEWRGAYTPEQTEMLEKMKAYLKGGDVEIEEQP